MNQRKIVVFIRADHPNDGVLAEAIQDYCRKRELSFFDFILDNQEKINGRVQLLERYRDRIRCIISCKMKFGGGNLSGSFGVPFVLYNMDPLFFDELDLTGIDAENVIISSFDNHEEKIWTEIVSPGFRSILTQMGHPTHPLVRNAPEPDFDTFKNKEDIAILAANFSSLGMPGGKNQYHLFDQLPEPDRKISISMAELCLNQNGIHYWDAYAKACDLHSEALVRQQRMGIFSAAFWFTRFEERQKIFDELIDHPVLFLGDDYPKAFTQIFPEKFCPVYNTNVFEVIRHSKIVISIGAEHWNAMGYRIPPTASLGSIALAEDNTFTRQTFPEGALRYYTYEKGSASNAITQILDDPHAAFDSVLMNYHHIKTQNIEDNTLDIIMTAVTDYWQNHGS
jgi:hypothetical protein